MRKIALITTSRADYGIQSRLIGMLDKDPDVEFTLVVSGSHLSHKHGLTVKEIESDGISGYQTVDIGIDNGTCVSEIMASALTGFSATLSRVRPDICILLGDRYEMLAGAIACALLCIPVAHLHGGETTIGANDEVFRHAITKASHLHFTSCEEYRRRVIQLGESPERVFNVGALGVENILLTKRLSRAEVESKIGTPLGNKNFLITFHPVTFEGGAAVIQTQELLAALGEMEDVELFFTRPNADAEGDLVARELMSFVEGRANAHFYPSLGSRLFVSLAACMDAVIGNSSSGIIEIPSLKVPTVNIGDRQLGRIAAESVVNCAANKVAILDAVQIVRSDKFHQKLQDVTNPYEKKGTAEEILRVLKNYDLRGICKKRFFDIDFHA